MLTTKDKNDKVYRECLSVINWVKISAFVPVLVLFILSGKLIMLDSKEAFVVASCIAVYYAIELFLSCLYRALRDDIDTLSQPYDSVFILMGRVIFVEQNGVRRYLNRRWSCARSNTVNCFYADKMQMFVAPDCTILSRLEIESEG